MAVPSRIVTNSDLCAESRQVAEEVRRLTGIVERRWAEPGQATSDLAADAARQALSTAGWSATHVDAILVSTTSPDTIFPSSACYVQRAIGARPIAAFDLAASCSGFLYGLSMADVLIRSGQYRSCLVLAAEVKSAFLNQGDPKSRVLFADGAGAALLIREDSQGPNGHGVLGVRLYAEGAHHNLIRVPAGGSRRPARAETVSSLEHTIVLDGAPIFRLAVRRLTTAVREQLKEFGVSVPDLRQCLFHQANGRILAALCKRLHIPSEKTISIIDRYGNTSSASLPMVLHEAVSTGRIGQGDLVLLGAFGGGLTWATALIRW
ncbi:3-oxoacyl-[acyl-carrier-protein] synthase 3 [Nitrospira sp.]|nr:3-oxoacyl-[acyl-carrier-protein] synthase 3 [Nitrospira sp.]